MPQLQVPKDHVSQTSFLSVHVTAEGEVSLISEQTWWLLVFHRGASGSVPGVTMRLTLLMVILPWLQTAPKSSPPPRPGAGLVADKLAFTQRSHARPRSRATSRFSCHGYFMNTPVQPCNTCCLNGPPSSQVNRIDRLS